MKQTNKQIKTYEGDTIISILQMLKIKIFERL